MSIVDIIQKLKIQANAIMRGIHPDFVLIERKDLEALLKEYAELSCKAFAHAQGQIGSTDTQSKGSTDSVWSKLPAEFKHDLEMTSKPCDYVWLHNKDGTTVCPNCNETGRWFCGGKALPGCEYVTPTLDQDFDDEVTPTDCNVSEFSSRMCQHGTKSCVVDHAEEHGKTLVDCAEKLSVLPKPTMSSSQLAFLAEPSLRIHGGVPGNYPDMQGEPTIGFKPYIPMRTTGAADCAHEWIPHPEHHSSRCKHCGATRSES